MRRLTAEFYDRDALLVARELIGKQLRRRWQGLWLCADVVEAEAYYRTERGSHASQGRTPSREPTWMAAGTIYMYHSQGGDSLNVSCHGDGNAVLFKAALATATGAPLAAMQRLNPAAGGGARDPGVLCRGQALLCRALALRKRDWSGRQFDDHFYVADTGYRPRGLIQAARLGIRLDRDADLLYRYVDLGRARHATSNPLTKRHWRRGRDYFVHPPPAVPPAPA